MERKKIKTGTFIFTFTLLLFILFDKYFGHINRFTTAFYEPSSWSEIYLKIPIYIVACLIMTIVILQILKQKEKMEEKNIDEARKRIEARKKITKEKKSKKSESDKEEK